MILSCFFRVRAPNPEILNCIGVDRIPGLSTCAKAISTCHNVFRMHNISCELRHSYWDNAASTSRVVT